MVDAEKRRADDSYARMAWRMSGMGLEFVAGVAGMGVVGWLVDRWLGSAPVWTLVGVAMGVIGSSYNFMRQAIRAGRQAQRAFRSAHPEGLTSRAEPSEADAQSQAKAGGDFLNMFEGQFEEQDDDDDSHAEP